MRFYNERRAQAAKAMPNAAHLALTELEKKAHVQVITQNVDDLHERAGNGHILHLHGMLNRSRSTQNPKLTYFIQGDRLDEGDLCELGSQLRPDIVWFGEDVPNIIPALEMVQKADEFWVVGTSLQVYPAAGLVFETPREAVIRYFDVEDPSREVLRMMQQRDFRIYKDLAGRSLPEVVDRWPD